MNYLTYKRQQAETYCRLYSKRIFTMKDSQSLMSLPSVQGMITKQQGTLTCGFKSWATSTAEQSEYIVFWHRPANGFEAAIIKKCNYIFSMIHGGSVAIPLYWTFNCNARNTLEKIHETMGFFISLQLDPLLLHVAT